jgi:BRCT domain type II-containing protein
LFAKKKEAEFVDPEKLKKAEKLGVKLIDEDDFWI